MTKRVSRSPERPYLHYVVMPSPTCRSDFLFVGTYAADSSFGSLNRSPRTIMAHAMRAILLASATAATLTGLRPIRPTSHSRFVPCWRA